jgi:F-type H+-transporting ATPase subunit O
VGEPNAAGGIYHGGAHTTPDTKGSEEEASPANIPCHKQYTAAAKSSTLDPTAKAIATLGALLQKDPKLAEILSAPTLAEADKKAIVAELTKQAGAQGATIKNFLEALAENNRLGLLGDVCEKFSTIISAARGEVEMRVTSAQV